MTSICDRCGGRVIGERVPDYYQARQWRCVNCGWYRKDTQLRPGRVICPAKRGVYQTRG